MTTPQTQAALLSEIMRLVDAYACDYLEHGKFAASRREVEQAILAKLQATQAEPSFPSRVMELLEQVADRNPGPYKAPWEDAQGLPMQDDADAAIAWIKARSVSRQAEPMQAGCAQSGSGDALARASSIIGAPAEINPEITQNRQEPAQAGELPPLPILGAVHTEIDGKVHLYPTAYKRLILEWWERGARAALASQTKQAGELPDEREAFEREMCAQHGLTPVYFRRNENGYQNTATESAWTGWQARAALAARKPLTTAQIDDLIHTKHFDRKYQKHASDEVCLNWYRQGIKDAEHAHGINGLEVKP